MDKTISEAEQKFCSSMEQGHGNGTIKKIGYGAEEFNTLYTKLHASVFFFACRFVGEAEASDVTADAFLKLWEKGVVFTEMRQCKSYLQKTVRNACIDIERHSQVSSMASKFLSLESTEYNEISFESQEARDLLIGKLFEEIEKLPPRCKLVFKLAYMERTKEREIASRLKISPHTVRAQIVKALAILRLKMKPYDWAYLFLPLYLIII
ncbi:MAG: sigma-70 family RNA polymerase sigma factor [Bacteroidetes bacterium]|nr:sigma-70 family RNA polymerase sigma factor [Bacteroidota bacterium]